VARILLEPQGIEAGFYRDQYEELISDLRAAGHEVVLKPRPETRSVDPVDVGRELIIRLIGHLEDGALDAIVAAVLLRLRGWKIGRKGQARRGVIYGPDGEVLREFDLPGADD
jgi:hypothetical protein